jgi:hypothetical protein
MKDIPILKPEGNGHQFVIYGDSCSGVPDVLHELTFAQMNSVIQRLEIPPEFICYPGDEIIGLTADVDELRCQWTHWFDHEMAWLDREAIPLYHTTGNHTTYNSMSEAIYRDVMAHLPQNGPHDQKGLSYFVRRDDLLMVFVHTLWSGLGGEGNVETDWLDQTLTAHGDAAHKLVFGHHPVWTVNGFLADYQRNIVASNGHKFWELLVQHDVLAYVCSHILAFDVQIHHGVLQICTAGAGAAHRMPDGVEYLHALQVALDEDGMCYQALDADGKVREWLTWDWKIPDSSTWQSFDDIAPEALLSDCLRQVENVELIIWEITGQLRSDDYSPTTLLCMNHESGALPVLWVGVAGRDHHLVVSLSTGPNRSPHSWYGPSLSTESSFTIQFAIHSGMGPGGLLWRWQADAPWSTLIGSSAWGVERLTWSYDWTTHQDIDIKWHHQTHILQAYL